MMSLSVTIVTAPRRAGRPRPLASSESLGPARRLGRRLRLIFTSILRPAGLGPRETRLRRGDVTEDEET